MTVEDSILEKLRALPDAKQREVLELVASRVVRLTRDPENHLDQDWAGDLKGFRNTFTSLDLQEKALEWRGD